MATIKLRYQCCRKVITIKIIIVIDQSIIIKIIINDTTKNIYYLTRDLFIIKILLVGNIGTLEFILSFITYYLRMLTD